MKIQPKLSLYFFLIAGLTTMAATFFAIYSVNRRYENIAEQEIASSKKMAESIFYENLGDLTRKATFLSELKEVIENIANPDELAMALESKFFFLSNLNIKIMDPAHRIVVGQDNSTPSNINQANIGQLPFFHPEWDPLLRDAGIFQVGQGIAIYSYSPIVEPETFELKGLMLLELPLNSVFTDEIKEKTKAEILIYLGDAKIASTFMDVNGQRYFPELTTLGTQQKILQSTFLLDSFPINDYSNRTLGRVFVGVNIQDIIEAKQVGIRSLILVFLAVIALGAVMGLFIGRRISRPLLVLSKGADSISKGHFDVAIDVASRDEVGQLARVFTQMASSLKEQTEEMSHMRLYLQNIIDSMPSVLIGVDTRGSITQWNQQAQKATGISQDQAFGKRVQDVFPFLEKQMETVQRAIAERMPQKTERVTAPVNGDSHYLDVMVYPLISNGLEGAVIRVDDVTTRVRIEEMMIQTEKMMSVGGLAAGMAHEINNPLGGIIQASQNVLRRLSRDLEKNAEVARECGTDLDQIIRYMEKREILKFLGGIRECGERAASIVENMLSFSRRSESRKSTTNLAVLLDKTVQLAANDYDLKKKYDFRHIEIRREFDPDLPDVPCVATEIQQVLLNLLKNAAQAMFRNPDDRKPPRINLRLRRDGGYVCMEIEDNGPGMDESTRKRIFEPFFTTKDVGVGTGLGLSVSYFIVTNNHQGNMMVESIPGQGTTFVIYLPLERGSA